MSPEEDLEPIRDESGNGKGRGDALAASGSGGSGGKTTGFVTPQVVSIGDVQRVKRGLLIPGNMVVKPKGACLLNTRMLSELWEWCLLVTAMEKSIGGVTSGAECARLMEELDYLRNQRPPPSGSIMSWSTVHC